MPIGVTPLYEYARGNCVPAASLWTFATTAIGWSAFTMTNELPGGMVASWRGSTKPERPGSICRVIVVNTVASAMPVPTMIFASVGAEPRFWMMNVVSQPLSSFATYGRPTRSAPELSPT